MRPQRLEPDVQRDAEEQDGREDGQQAELAEPLRALGGRAVRGPPHLVHPLQLVHDAWFAVVLDHSEGLCSVAGRGTRTIDLVSELHEDKTKKEFHFLLESRTSRSTRDCLFAYSIAPPLVI